MEKTDHDVFRLRISALELSDKKTIQLAVVVFDLPGEKVNKFNSLVMGDFEHLIAHLEEATKNKQIDVIALTSAKPGQFIAGADITMIQAAKTKEDAEALSRKGQILLDRWEDLSAPTVAVVNGPCMGGGCELSLASTAIVISNDPGVRIGLPEVMLGVIPGMGGCVRLPRKIGLAQALDMILTGKTLNGERAAKAGLADACIPKENFESQAFKWIAANYSKLNAGVSLGKKPVLGGMGGPIGSLLENTSMGRGVMLGKARDGVMSKTKGKFPAPLEAIDVLSDTSGHYGKKLRGTNREKAMMREAAGFGKMAETEVSKNLISLFFMTEVVKKSKGVTTQGIQFQKVTQAAVLGAGVMGGGIAQLLANKNVPCRMKDISLQGLTTGTSAAAKIFGRDVKKRKLNQREYLQKMNLISPVTDYAGFKSVDFVIEAIVEKIEVKQKLLQEIEHFIKSDCIIASNTSSLSITKMQSVMKNPERFAGMHFFNPVHKMPLVEVIRGEKSSDTAVSTVYQFTKALGKTPIVTKDTPGFLVNRLLLPFLNEACWLLADGAPIDEIDQALGEFGMPMGAMELIDEVGVDVGDKVSHILNDAFGPRMLPSVLNSKIVAAGRLGKKNGKGMYDYDTSLRQKNINPQIYKILEVQPIPGKIRTQEIVERCIYPMINEASRCLEDKVVESASEVDLGMIMGTGFPPFRGGLLRYADSVGLDTVIAGLKKYSERFGVRYEPSQAILDFSKRGGFYKN